MTEPSRFTVSIDALEESARVPVEQQVEGQSVDEHPEYVSPEDLDRLRLLNDPAGAGRLRLR